MTMQEIIERGLMVDESGKVLDNFGNEYRNENGNIEYIEY